MRKWKTGVAGVLFLGSASAFGAEEASFIPEVAWGTSSYSLDADGTTYEGSATTRVFGAQFFFTDFHFVAAQFSESTGGATDQYSGLARNEEKYRIGISSGGITSALGFYTLDMTLTKPGTDVTVYRSGITWENRMAIGRPWAWVYDIDLGGGGLMILGLDYTTSPFPKFKIAGQLRHNFFIDEGNETYTHYLLSANYSF